MTDKELSPVPSTVQAVRPAAPPYAQRGDAVVVLREVDPDDLVGDLRRQVRPLLDAPPARLILDLSCLTSLSSGAVAALLWVRGVCVPRGIPVRLRHLPRGGVATLRRTGLSAALPVERTGR